MKKKYIFKVMIYVVLYADRTDIWSVEYSDLDLF